MQKRRRGRGLITPTRCPQMYPELQIARVEQATQAIPMEQWCGDARGGRCAHPHHQVVPFRCLGESQAGGGERKEAGGGVGGRLRGVRFWPWFQAHIREMDAWVQSGTEKPMRIRDLDSEEGRASGCGSVSHR